MPTGNLATPMDTSTSPAPAGAPPANGATPDPHARFVVAAAATLMMVCLGTIYSWSVYTQVLMAGFGWSNTQVTGAIALGIFSVGLGAAVGGLWQDRVGPRNVALAGAVMWGIGNIAAGLGTQSLGMAWLYATYGLLGGFGVGMAYITPVATVTKWFPRQKGLAGGIVATGFGAGAVFYSLTLQAMPSFNEAATVASAFLRSKGATAALSAMQLSGVLDLLAWSGLLFGAAGGLCAMMLRNPPASAASQEAAAVPADASSFTTIEMLRSRQFYILWLMFFINVTAGILLMSNAIPIIQSLTNEAPTVAATAFSIAAIFNAVGRFFWGSLSDKLGRRAVFALLFALQALLFAVLGSLHDLVAVTAVLAAVLLCLGGGFGVMPSFNADYFGVKNVGANYGMLLTAWGCAGIVGPLLAARVSDLTGSYGNALMAIAGILAVAVVLPAISRKPVKGARLEETPAGVPEAVLSSGD
jgi:MFS transporter, OFA family, oxalate/formate antiporter